MAQQTRKKGTGPQPVNSMERLLLRVSSMINHPVTQERREVRIHRLDTDGEREWCEILNAMSEADGIEMTLHDEDGSVTLRWEPCDDDESPPANVREETVEQVEPF